MRKIKIDKPYFVTFQIKYPKALGIPTKRYAIKCYDMERARYIASDIYSLNGISYLRINQCGKVRKGAKVIDGETNYVSEIN